MPLTAAAVSKPFHLLRIGAKIAVAATADPAATRIIFSLFPMFALITLLQGTSRFPAPNPDYPQTTAASVRSEPVWKRKCEPPPHSAE
jgi:hypothetical protein